MADIEAKVNKILGRRVPGAVFEETENPQDRLWGQRLVKAHASFIHNTLVVVDALQSCNIDIADRSLSNMFALLDGDMDSPWIAIPQSEYKHDLPFEVMVEETDSLNFLDRLLKENCHSLRNTIAFDVFPLISRSRQRRLDDKLKALVTNCIFGVTVELITTFKPDHVVLLQCETSRMYEPYFTSLRGYWSDDRARMLGSTKRDFLKQKSYGEATFGNKQRLRRTMGINPASITEFDHEDLEEPFANLIYRCFPASDTEHSGNEDSRHASTSVRRLQLLDCFSALLSKVTTEQQSENEAKPASSQNDSSQSSSWQSSDTPGSSQSSQFNGNLSFLAQSILDKLCYEQILAVCTEVLADCLDMPPPLSPTSSYPHGYAHSQQTSRSSQTLRGSRTPGRSETSRSSLSPSLSEQARTPRQRSITDYLTPTFNRLTSEASSRTELGDMVSPSLHAQRHILRKRRRSFDVEERRPRSRVVKLESD